MLHEITIIEEAARCLMCYDPPCSKACPASSNPASFIKAIRLENIKGGARAALESNILGNICADFCPSSKYCEGACIRGKIDRPVNIKMLHGYVAETGSKYEFAVSDKKVLKFKAAIIGTNMAGLSAAAELAKNGVSVDVISESCFFESQLQAQFTDKKADSTIFEDSVKSIKSLGINFVPDKSGGEFSEYDAMLVTTKKSLHDLPSESAAPRLFFTGELASGPDDAAFSVRKGKEAAKSMLKYFKEAVT